MFKFLIHFILLVTFAVTAQKSGNANGQKMYPVSSIARLKPVADSLTAAYNNSPVKQINSIWQGRARYIYAEGSSARKFKKAIDAGAGLDVLSKIDASALSARDYLVVRFTERKKGQPVLRFEHFSLGAENHHELELTAEAYQNYKDKRQGYFYRYEEGNGDNDYLAAFYFDTPMYSRPLPENYVHDVRYARTIINTGGIYLDRERNNYLNHSKKEEWSRYANDKLRAAGYPPNSTPDNEESNTITTADGREIEISAAKWRELRRRGIDSLMKHDADFVRIFREAIVQADLFPGISSNEFEDYVSRYDSKKKALRYKRSRHENCSWQHNYRIAAMAAEIGDFKVFLRGHLEIMDKGLSKCEDDEEIKDSGEYLKVLNDLGLEPSRLLLGAYLNIDVLPEEAFQSTTSSTAAWLFDASTNKEKTADTILAMIADPALDDFNRLLMSYIYGFYAVNFNDTKRALYAVKHKAASATLPAYAQGNVQK